MSIQFNPHPGPRERQLQRKYNNPLFGEAANHITQEQVDDARHRDETDLDHFLRAFRDLVQEAIDLQPNSDSEVILDIKARLDQSYTLCCALPGEHSEIKNAIDKLVEVIMKAVRQGAANDPVALDKLSEEDIARRMHQEMQQYSLVADLLLPDSPIQENELLASLLSESPESLQATLKMFEAEHLQLLYRDGKALLEECKNRGEALPAAWHNLSLFEAALLSEPGKSPN